MQYTENDTDGYKSAVLDFAVGTILGTTFSSSQKGQLQGRHFSL